MLFYLQFLKTRRKTGRGGKDYKLEMFGDELQKGRKYGSCVTPNKTTNVDTQVPHSIWREGGPGGQLPHNYLEVGGGG